MGNEWTLSKFVPVNVSFSPYFRFVVWVLNVILIFAGIIFVLQKDLSLARWIGIAGLAVAVIPLLVCYVFRMGYTFQIDYNEGWNVYHAMEAVTGQLLYANHFTWTPVNYPPISFYLVGSLGKLFHNPLLAGRVISLISLLFISLGSGIIVRRLGGNKFAAVFSSVFCLGLFVTYARGYIGMNDPQMLGQAIILTGLMIYLRDKPRWLPVALLSCFGIFVKHNLMPIPIAISIDILLRSRKDFLKWFLACMAIGVGFLAMITIYLGHDFLYQLTALRGYDFGRIVTWPTRLGPALFITLLLTTPGLLQMTKRRFGRVIFLYLAISILWGLYTAGGTGTDVNIFSDFFIGLSIAAGINVEHLYKKLELFEKRTVLVPILLPLILGFGILGRFPKLFPRPATFYQYSQKEQVFLEDADYLRSRLGPAICTNILLCYVSGHSFIVDPFLVTEGIISGRYQEDVLLSQIRAGYYQVIQLEYPLDSHYCEGLSYTDVRRSEVVFTENVLRAVGNHYVLTRKTSTGAFYEPK